MAKEKAPVTPAIRLLKKEGVPYKEHLYQFAGKGVTAHASEVLGLDEHLLIKTLIMEDDRKNPLIILMHGDLQVSTRGLARALGVKSVTPCTPEVAQKHSGYLVGGTSPFGVRHPMPVYIEDTILELPCIYINGGKRGFMIEMATEDLVRVLKPTPVHVGFAPGHEPE
ncbi:MAG TPA: aminoacyl-tRNA deacylase [Armatimonadota bacterium]|nr:aminoacyl-tRNA deacylase [Armatimonadota bacterium]